MAYGTNYIASDTMSLFHRDESFVRGLMGPIGSGKSVACCMEMLRISLNQAPNPYGVRQTRWVVVRNTYRELIDTTIQTFFDWFPEHLGNFKKMDLKFETALSLDDGTHAEIEFLFRAMDRPNDIKKLLSLEVTGGWINEAREVPKPIMDMLIGRLGRYPSKRMGGPTRHCLIMDTNPPDDDHWWYKIFEETRPDGYKLFKQPSGLSERAENVENLPDNYYKNMQYGKDQEWINVYVHGKYGFVATGKPVYPQYNDDVHFNDTPIAPQKDIFVGIDFGLTPAALFLDQTSTGQIRAIDELVTFDMASFDFAKLLNAKISREYEGHNIVFIGDPAGNNRAETDEETPFRILRNHGIHAKPASTNDPVIRVETVAKYLRQLDFAGKPSFIIGPKCIIFRKAMNGGYKYRRMQIAGEERFRDVPDKNRYSHVAEAGQYGVLGMVGTGELLGTIKNKKQLDYSHIDRMIV